MPILSELPTWDADGCFRVVVESPAGSRIKFKYDPHLQVFTVSRPLVMGLAYPCDWGFIPSTLGLDGDPFDAMCLNDLPSFPGVVMSCRAIGAVRLTQKKETGGGRESDDRVIAVPACHPRYDDVHDADDLPDRTRKELELFFENAVLLEGKKVTVEGWAGRKPAEKLIAKAAKRFLKRG